MSITDEALERVNCFGIGAWLETTLRGLQRPFPPSDLSPDSFYITKRFSGLVLTLSRMAKSMQNPRDAFVLSRIEGDATAPMPLGLNPALETPKSAVGKLSTNTASGSRNEIARGDRRLSFFLRGGRVVELRFNADSNGFDRILIARLGEALDWREPQNR